MQAFWAFIETPAVSATIAALLMLFGLWTLVQQRLK